MSAPASPPSAESRSNVVEFSVSEISFALKRMVEENFEHVRVRGEISGFRGPAGSGHCYFTLKDDRACIDAVVWKTTFQRLRFKPEEGLEMVATGKLTTFPGRSRYQIVIDSLEPAGAGALMALLQERLAKLRAEGLFDEARKRPLPYMPRVIGVVTSPTGAVIRDILHRLRDRFPCHVLVWPVRVQGEGAAEEVAAALRGFDRLETGGPIPRPDLLIVARGGGSIEDLWAFNEEVVVRAIAESAIPTISAVGHETDVTLADHAADRRAPTPTGAAEIAVPVRAELMAVIRDLTSRHDLAMRRGVEHRRRDAAALGRSLPRLADLMALPRQRLDEAGGRLTRGLGTEVARKRAACDSVGARLSPALLARAQERRRERLDGLHVRLARAHQGDIRQLGRSMRQVSVRLDPACLARIVARHRERYAQTCRLFQTLQETVSPQAMLARGYAIIEDGSGEMVRSAAALSAGDAIGIRFADGRVEAMVAGDRPKPRKKAAPPKQQTLF